MSKALVINGANFASNKVAKVNLEEAVPCTGITISQSQITLTSIGATATLTATTTPIDTTDTVVWISSNEDCATVANGVVTCVGVGTATITASCGTHSATCTVSCAITIILDNSYSKETGVKYSGSLNLNNNPPKNHLGLGTAETGELFYKSTNDFTYKMFVTSTTVPITSNAYGIPIPSGTTKITVTPPSELVAAHDRVVLLLANADEKQTYVTGSTGNAAMGLAAFRQSLNDGAVPLVCDISQYTTANAFAVTLVNGTTVSGNVSVTFE